VLRLKCVACAAVVDARLPDCPGCGASPLAGEPAVSRLRRFAPGLAVAGVAGLALVALDEPAIGDYSDVHVLAAIVALPDGSCREILAREPAGDGLVETVTCADGERYRIDLAPTARVRAARHR
jgi:hypothetical protein